MRGARIGRWVRAGILSLLVLHPAGAPTVRLLAPVAVVPALAAAGAAFAPGEAWARASSRSSGGYSRPAPRTPSAGSGGYSRPSTPRTPSVGSPSRRDVAPSSGGYGRPGSGAAPERSTSTSRSPGAGDQTFSRQGSADALDRFRSRQQAERAPSAAPAPDRGGTQASRPPGGSDWGTSYDLPRVRAPRSTPAPRPASEWNRYGWAPPPYAVRTAPRFGLWDGLFLWFLLDTLSRPGHAAFFHDNADDPGVRAWREQAGRLAEDNADLRDKLDRLDREVAAQSSEPRSPGRLPSDVPADMARADAAAEDADAGSGGLWWGVLLVGGVLFLVWVVWRRSRRATAAGGTPAVAARKEKDTVPLFGTLGNYVDRKLSGERYKPSLFRLGMTLTIDPTPFLLAAGVTKVAAPDVGGTDRLTGVEAVGTVRAGGANVHRLYLPGGKSFFQIHLDEDGRPDECRLFTVIDEVTPADEAEWGFWLDEAEGMIGWPEFQTKDGRTYQRAWSPGGSRIRPFTMSETVETTRGSRTDTVHAMLYAAPTGAAEPAPETEYILVQAIERGGQAWVQVAAGIDVNPASLSLA